MTRAQRGVEQLRGSDQEPGPVGPIVVAGARYIGQKRAILGGFVFASAPDSIFPLSRTRGAGSWCPACVIEVVAPRNHR